MLIEEFYQMTGIYPTPDEYRLIEEKYMDAAEDKKRFCERFLEKEMQISIVRELSLEQQKNQKKELKEIEKYKAKVQDQEAIIQKLQKLLEIEQEWHEYGNCSKMEDNDYKALQNCGRQLSETEAKSLLSEWYGFNPDKVKILEQLESYQMNRHKKLRVSGISFRPPIYAATDWNYIRFECGLGSYELIDGMLQIFDT